VTAEEEVVLAGEAQRDSKEEMVLAGEAQRDCECPPTSGKLVVCQR
jgi:hypothetical protein